MRNLIIGLLPMFVSAAVSAADWNQANGSEFGFEASFEGSALPGEFNDFEVRFGFDAESPADAVLEVRVQLAAADMGDPDMNAVLMDPAWFDTARYSEALFESRDVRKLPDGGFEATGILDLKGEKKEVRVPFTWREDGDRATMAGGFSLNRNDYDVGSGEWSGDDSIGLNVELTFVIEFERND